MKKDRNGLHSNRLKEAWGDSYEEDGNLQVPPNNHPQEIYTNLQENIHVNRFYNDYNDQNYSTSSSPFLMKQNLNGSMHNGQYCDSTNLRNNYHFNRNTLQNYNALQSHSNNGISYQVPTDRSFLTDTGTINSMTMTTVNTPNGPTMSRDDRYRGMPDLYTRGSHRYNSDTSLYLSSISSEDNFQNNNRDININQNNMDPYLVIKQANAQKLKAIIFQGDMEDTNPNEIFTLQLRNLSLDDVISLRVIVPNAISCDLSGNNINSLNGLPIRTTKCYCSHNKITSDGCHLDELTHLESLDISANCVGPDLSFLKHCLHLRVINLSHNNISSLDGLSNSWVPLKELDLSHNYISGTIDFKEVIYKSKHSNGKRQEDKGWFSIEILNLSHNQITQIKNISYLPSLKELKLNGNPIESIIDTSKKYSQLRKLSIKGTSYKLQHIKGPNGTEIPYPFLIDLQIDGFRDMSKLNNFPTEIVNLEIVDCFKGHLPKWKLFPESIKTLTLQRINDLKELPTNFSTILPNLESLNLSNNNLSSCYNILSTIPIRNLTTIDLRGNPVAIKYEIENQDQEKEDISGIRCQHDKNDGRRLKPNLFNLLCLGCPKLRTILLRGKDKSDLS